jgi:phosphoglycerate dehydrogenase-like enzyme
MAAKIVMVRHAFADIGIAQEMLPAGYELANAQPGTAEFRAAMTDAKYLVGFGDPSMDDAFYRGAPRLKLVQLLSAGYDRCDIEAARHAGVPICNNGGSNSVAVAEHAMLLMLAVCRQLVWQHTTVTSGAWRGNDWTAKRLDELYGRTLGIIGLGNIGKKVARLGRAFGMNVQYYDIVRLNEDAEDALGARFRLFREVLQTSDVITLHVPHTAATHHMIDAAALALVKPSAILINTCRGPVVEETALHRALTTGGIQAAGLDVFEQEPTHPDNPLFGLDNVVLTPHLAGPTWENRFKGFRNAFDNVQRVERGEKPLWIIPELRE